MADHYPAAATLLAIGDLLPWHGPTGRTSQPTPDNSAKNTMFESFAILGLTLSLEWEKGETSGVDNRGLVSHLVQVEESLVLRLFSDCQNYMKIQAMRQVYLTRYTFQP